MSEDKWAVGKVEQLLILKSLEDRLTALELSRSGILISAYRQPTRQDWESRYKALGGTLPIVPGTKLCWLNLRSNLIETFTTVFDNDNGLSSSGEVYDYVSLENVSPVRFLGQVNLYNQLIMNGDTPANNISFGLNWNRWRLLNLYKIRIFFRIYNTNTMQFTVNERLQIVPPSSSTTTVYKVVDGKCQIPGPATAVLNNQSTLSSPDPDIDLSTPDGGTSTTAPMIGLVDIYAPFRLRESDSYARSLASSWSIHGWLFNMPGAANAKSFLFSVHSIASTPLIPRSEMFPVQQITTPALESTAWAYGYFAETPDTMKEYSDDN